MTRGTFIENEVAYNRAIDRNIRANANKTRRATWLATPDGKRADEFLFQYGEFEHTNTHHPVVKASLGDFYSAMRDAAMEWARLSPAQTRAVIGMITRAEARLAGYAAKRAEEAVGSNWIGTVGERRDFIVTIRHIHTMEGQFGTSFLHVLNDAQGNVVIYKGTKCLGDRGETLTVKATVKEHGEREGVKQTKIARPA